MNEENHEKPVRCPVRDLNMGHPMYEAGVVLIGCDILLTADVSLMHSSSMELVLFYVMPSLSHSIKTGLYILYIPLVWQS